MVLIMNNVLVIMQMQRIMNNARVCVAETLIELILFISSFLSLASCGNWTSIALSSSSRQQYLSQQLTRLTVP